MPNDQQNPRQIVTQLLHDFEDLLIEVRETQSFDHFFQRFDRWKERAVERLNANVSSREAERLSQLPDRPSWVQMEPPDAVTEPHHAFLVGLLQDIDRHPDSFGTPTKTAEKQRPARSVLPRPERITPAWVWRNVDAYWLIGVVVACVVVLGGAFVAGVKVGASPSGLRLVGPAIGIAVAPDTSRGAGRTTPPKAAH